MLFALLGASATVEFLEETERFGRASVLGYYQRFFVRCKHRRLEAAVIPG